VVKTGSMEKRKVVSLPADMAQAIEDYRFANRLKTGSKPSGA
jgi:hypothetical protein